MGRNLTNDAEHCYPALVPKPRIILHWHKPADAMCNARCYVSEQVPPTNDHT